MRFGAVNTLKHCSQNKVGLNKITFRIIIYSFYNLVHSTVPPPTLDRLKLKYGQVFMNAKIYEELSLNKTSMFIIRKGAEEAAKNQLFKIKCSSIYIFYYVEV